MRHERSRIVSSHDHATPNGEEGEGDVALTEATPKHEPAGVMLLNLVGNGAACIVFQGHISRLDWFRTR